MRITPRALTVASYQTIESFLFISFSFICPVQKRPANSENENPGCSGPQMVKWTSRPYFSKSKSGEADSGGL